MLEIGIRLAYASVNVCVHSSTVRQNRAVFGYVLALIPQYGSGEPLRGIGGVGTAPYGLSDNLLRVNSPMCYILKQYNKQ